MLQCLTRRSEVFSTRVLPQCCKALLKRSPAAYTERIRHNRRTTGPFERDYLVRTPLRQHRFICIAGRQCVEATTLQRKVLVLPKILLTNRQEYDQRGISHNARRCWCIPWPKRKILRSERNIPPSLEPSSSPTMYTEGTRYSSRLWIVYGFGLHWIREVP